MGNYECKYCEYPYEYYLNKNARTDNLVSKNKYHFFSKQIIKYVSKVKKFY